MSIIQGANENEKKKNPNFSLQKLRFHSVLTVFTFVWKGANSTWFLLVHVVMGRSPFLKFCSNIRDDDVTLYCLMCL